MLIRSHTINSLLKLHVVCFFCFVFCIVHGSLNLDVVSLVIRLIAAIYCTHVYWVTHDSGISPFWFALYKLHNFLVNRGHPFMTSTKKITFLTPLPTCVHRPDPPSPLLWTSTHGLHEIHTALLKWLVQ